MAHYTQSALMDPMVADEAKRICIDSIKADNEMLEIFMREIVLPVYTNETGNKFVNWYCTNSKRDFKDWLNRKFNNANN